MSNLVFLQVLINKVLSMRNGIIWEASSNLIEAVQQVAFCLGLSHNKGVAASLKLTMRTIITTRSTVWVIPHKVAYFIHNISNSHHQLIIGQGLLSHLARDQGDQLLVGSHGDLDHPITLLVRIKLIVLWVNK